MVNREMILYNGVKYARYPDSKYISYRRYFYAFSKGKDGTTRTTLHRQIWKDVYGEIPKGYDIHHKGGDFLNNDISNLECIPKKEHSKKHYCEPDENILAHLNRIRPLTKEWHASVEGLQWHSDHGRQVWENMEGMERICEMCGKAYLTKCARTNIRFCSRKCINRNIEITRKNVVKTCEHCGIEFKTRKNREAKFCSNQCYHQHRRLT